MNETSLSLLQRLGQPQEPKAWLCLQQIYEPLLRKWLVTYDVQRSDADDLVQEVLLAVASDIQSFRHNGRSGAFRAWLKGILVNRLRKFWRGRARRPNPIGGTDIDQRIADLEDPAGPLTLVWNKEHDRHVLRVLLAMSQPHFERTTWAAFQMTTFEGVKPAQAAAELGISINAVVIAKSRVLKRLRHEASGLVETSTEIFPRS